MQFLKIFIYFLLKKHTCVTCHICGTIYYRNYIMCELGPNTKRFRQTLIYFNTDTQYANFRGNPLHQATKRHLNNKQSKMMKNERKRILLFWLSQQSFYFRFFVNSDPAFYETDNVLVLFFTLKSI